MYIVKIWYNDNITVYSFRSKKQAYQKFYGWYNHGLDMYGQVKSKIEIWHNDICIDADLLNSRNAARRPRGTAAPC